MFTDTLVTSEPVALVTHPDPQVQPLDKHGRPVSVTLKLTKRPRKRPDRSKRQEPTVADLRLMCKARGLKVVSAHTKGELLAMFTSGAQIRPAAYDRANAKRKAAKA